MSTTSSINFWTNSVRHARPREPEKDIRAINPQRMHKSSRDLPGAADAAGTGSPSESVRYFVAESGDIHGQYSDLLKVFEYGGWPGESNYLFIGDYVDRGKNSIECIMLLLCYKIKFPENFFVLRGNHENSSINRIYGFYDECTFGSMQARGGTTSKFGSTSWMSSTSCLSLPLSTRRSSACMGDFPPASTNLPTL